MVGDGSPRPHTPAPTASGWWAPAAPPEGGQSREGTTAEGTPPGDALPPPPRRATPARKGARRGAGAGSPHRHRPHPGHTGRRTPAARPRGRAPGGGIAPDTRRPSQRWQATPPGDGPPPPPRHAPPAGHAGQGDSVGPLHPHTRAHNTWVADPNGPPSGRAVGGGGAPDLRRPSQQWKAFPPGTPFRHPHSEQSRPARAHAVEPVLGPHARTDRTQNTRVAVPRLPASEDGRSGEGQRLTPDAPHNSGRTPPPGTAPHHTTPAGHAGQGDSVGPPHPHTRAHSTWVADPNSPPSGRAVGGGGAPDLRRPPQQQSGRGNRDRTAPPQSTPDGARDRGRTRRRGTDNVERPYQRPEPGPREVRTPHHPGGGGADTAGARAHTHAKGTRGPPEGQPDRARRTHRPRGMAYQRARVRDTRTGRPATRSAGHAGRDGGIGRDTTRGTGPSPPEPAASATHTRTGHCTRQGSSGALRHAPTPRLGSLRARQRGSHWRQASSTGPAAPTPRATTH